MRAESVGRLVAAGFRSSAALPWWGDGALRPAEEVARRLAVLQVCNLWVHTEVPREVLQAMVDRDGLGPWFAADEPALWAASRADARGRWGRAMGWKQEQMWALAWVLDH